MRIKPVLAVAAIVLISVAIGMVVVNSNPGPPPDLRVSLLNDTLFIRWTSQEPSVGTVYYGNGEVSEGVPRELHRVSLPYSSDLEKLRIVERVNGEEVATYCIKMDEVSLSPVRVGLYTDVGAYVGSYRSLEDMLTSMGFKVDELKSFDFSLEKISRYDFLAFPGGRADGMISTLGEDKLLNIREYVAMGGGYIGICAGAYLASNYTVWHGVQYGDSYGYVMDLYSGKAIGPIEEIGDYDTDSPYNPQHPTDVVWYDGRVLNVTYWGGPYFSPVDSSDVLATYEKVDEPAAIKTEFHGGRAVLFGFHPELDTGYSQENSRMIFSLCNQEFLWVAGITS